MIRTHVGGILLALTLAAAALTQATYSRAATKYDGNWSLVVYTRHGACNQSYRFSGQIVNGVIAYYGIISLNGRVRPGGAAYARVSSGANYAVAYGHMTATRGSGVWHGQAPSGICSGTWAATRSY